MRPVTDTGGSVIASPLPSAKVVQVVPESDDDSTV